MTEITFDEQAMTVHLVAGDDVKVKNLAEMMLQKLVKRGVPPKALSFEPVETRMSGQVAQVITMQQGIPQEKAKEIVKLIKETKLRVQAQIQEDQVRVSGKSRDDLQAILSMLKEKDLGIALQFVNYRSP